MSDIVHAVVTNMLPDDKFKFKQNSHIFSTDRAEVVIEQIEKQNDNCDKFKDYNFLFRNIHDNTRLYFVKRANTEVIQPANGFVGLRWVFLELRRGTKLYGDPDTGWIYAIGGCHGRNTSFGNPNAELMNHLRLIYQRHETDTR